MIRVALCAITLALLGAGCHTGECSICPPGMHPSDSSNSCSLCVCYPDAGPPWCGDASADGSKK